MEWVFHFALNVLFTDANGGGCHALSGDCVMISFLGAEAFAVYWNWNNPKRYYFQYRIQNCIGAQIIILRKTFISFIFVPEVL